MMEQLDKQVQNLTAKERKVIELTRMGLSPKEIAVRLDCTPNAVSILKNRATDKLKEKFNGTVYAA